jgi:hypothetical protein
MPKTAGSDFARITVPRVLIGSRALDQTQVPPAGLAPGWFQDRAQIVVESPVQRGIPSRRRRRLQDKLADATGYPLPAPPVLRQANTPHVPLACHYHRSTTVNSGVL